MRIIAILTVVSVLFIAVPASAKDTVRLNLELGGWGSQPMVDVSENAFGPQLKFGIQLLDPSVRPRARIMLDLFGMAVPSPWVVNGVHYEKGVGLRGEFGIELGDQFGDISVLGAIRTLPELNVLDPQFGLRLAVNWLEFEGGNCYLGVEGGWMRHSWSKTTRTNSGWIGFFVGAGVQVAPPLLGGT